MVGSFSKDMPDSLLESDLLFDVSTPLGFRVRVTRAYWELIVTVKPPVKATLDWLAPVKDSGGAYSPDPVAAQELCAVWEAEQLAKGQTVLPGMDKERQ